MHLKYINIRIKILAGVELMKTFATAKNLRATQALLPGADEKFFKLSIAIFINCIGKMLI